MNRLAQRAKALPARYQNQEHANNRAGQSRCEIKHGAIRRLESACASFVNPSAGQKGSALSSNGFCSRKPSPWEPSCFPLEGSGHHQTTCHFPTWSKLESEGRRISSAGRNPGRCCACGPKMSKDKQSIAICLLQEKRKRTVSLEDLGTHWRIACKVGLELRKPRRLKSLANDRKDITQGRTWRSDAPGKPVSRRCLVRCVGTQPASPP